MVRILCFSLSEPRGAERYIYVTFLEMHDSEISLDFHGSSSAGKPSAAILNRNK
jgi:hypothetical protein